MPYLIQRKGKRIRFTRMGRVGKTTLVPRENIQLDFPLSDSDQSTLTQWYAARAAERKARQK